jgi:hypothetical protein
VLLRVFGATLHVLDGIRVAVEVEAGSGLPAFHIVGQADRVVNESRDRIRAAFRHAGLEFPPGRVTVNLAPTGLPKVGSALDLPIAVGIAGTRVELQRSWGRRCSGRARACGWSARCACDAGAVRAVDLQMSPSENLSERALPRVEARSERPGLLRWLRDETLEPPGAATGLRSGR